MYIEENIREKAGQILSPGRSHMGQYLNIEFETISRDEMKARMPVDERTIQPFGILHGGASVVLAETLASIGAWLNIDETTKTAVGLEINANHIRSVPAGEMVTGISRPVHKGSQTHVWETRIETPAGKLVCISRCTLAIIRKR